MLRLALLFTALASLVWAQNSSSVTGSITDKSGAAVAAAKVTVQNLDTQITRDVITDNNGIFTLVSGYKSNRVSWLEISTKSDWDSMA